MTRRGFIPAFFLLWTLIPVVGWAQDTHDHRLPTITDLRFEVQDDPAEGSMTLRLGPVTLLPHAAHVRLPEQHLTLPFNGWITGFYPRVVDGSGRRRPGGLLHHMGFFNTARRNFLCPHSNELLFAAGSELKDWEAPPGLGYPAMKGHHVRIQTMFHNPSDTDVQQVYVEVRVRYRLLEQKPPLTSVYWAWFWVGECGSTLYDLDPGQNEFSSRFTIDYPGRLLFVGGHLHDYGRQLSLRNLTREEMIAVLTPSLDSGGYLLSVPIVEPGGGRGYRLSPGDIVEVAMRYDNTTGRILPRSAMGIALGVFLPDEEERFIAMTTRSSHDMPASPPPQARSHADDRSP